MEESLEVNKCWFCHQDDERETFFSWKFNTGFHETCLEIAFKEGNPDAIIMRQEFLDND